MSIGGGGFFGSGKSDTKQTSTAAEVGQQLNESTGSSAYGWGNLTASGKNSNVNVDVYTTTTDNGAIKSAMDMAGKVLESQNNSRLVDYDIFKLATDSSMDGVKTAAYLGYDGLKINGDLLGKTLTEQTAANANFLGKIENWSELVDSNNKAVMNLADLQTKRAYDFASSENDANRVLLSDANKTMGNFFETANRGLLNFAVDSANKSYSMQNEAVKQINNAAQIASQSSRNAMDMIFESTKTAEERVLTNSTKWIIGGLIGIVAVFVIAPKFGGAA